MDDESFKDLARGALALYRLTLQMQKRMLDMFFHEFVNIEQHEQDQQAQGPELPF